jgi:hypothetical protein
VGSFLQASRNVLCIFRPLPQSHLSWLYCPNNIRYEFDVGSWYFRLGSAHSPQHPVPQTVCIFFAKCEKYNSYFSRNCRAIGKLRYQSPKVHSFMKSRIGIVHACCFPKIHHACLFS